MAFKAADFNKTEQVPEKGVFNLVSGKRNAIFLRNRYQTELDNANAAVVDMVHYCEDKSKELKEAFNKAEGIKASIQAHEKEREQAYEALGTLLNKETDFEKVMHKETTGMYKEVSKAQAAKSIKIKQRMVSSDNEMRFASMMKYLDKYPEYQSKSSFKKIVDKIEEKEREIRHAKIDKEKAISAYHDLLQTFKIYIQKAKDKVKMYHQLLDEGQKKIDETRYKKSVAYKLASERSKSEVNLDIIKHRMPQFENTLKIIEEELSQYEGRKFVELSRN
jgi:hypothetical protein